MGISGIYMKYLKKIGSLTLCALLGAGVGMITAKYGADLIADINISTPIGIGIFFLSIAPGLFFAVLVHEMGHLFFGVKSGLKPVALMVGPFDWEFSPGKKWPKLKLLKGFQGGITICLPPHSANLKRSLAYYVAGGPIASFMLALFCILALLTIKGWPMIFFGFTAFISLLLGLFNLYPNRVFGMYTDGARLLAIFQGGKRFKEMNAQFQLSAYLHIEESPDSWPQDLVETLLNAETLSPEWRAGHYYRYMQARFANDWAAAKEHLSLASKELCDMPQAIKNSYIKEGALLCALMDGDIAGAAKTLRETGKSLMTQAHTLSIYSAIQHMNEENYNAAAQALDKAEFEARDTMFKGLISLALQDIRLLRAQLNKQDVA